MKVIPVDEASEYPFEVFTIEQYTRNCQSARRRDNHKACESVPNYTQLSSYTGSAKSVFFGKIAFLWKIQVQNNADRRETCFDLSIEASTLSAY